MSDATGSDVEDLPEDEIPVGGLPAIQEAPQGEGQVIPQGEEQAVPISDEQKPAANEEQAIPQGEEQAVPISDEQKPAANEEQAIPQGEKQAKPVSDEQEVPVGEIQEAPVKEGEVPEGEVLPEGEESLEGEEVEVVEEEEIPEFLDPDFFISKPILSEKCTLPEDFLIFDYSFGYDCKKFFNLVLLEENVLVFYSGNILHIFNTKTKELWFRRSAGGGGIGHIAKNPNPNYNHLAVAETGDVPLIIIYEWPTFEIVAVLKEGTMKKYTFIHYCPDGEMLCSQGGEPDYQITVWNWHASRIILRSQAYINDVFVCRFSPTVPGSITTSGVSHIKFWKMARTFTGLKLMGSLGRFGKTEMCNIIGFYSLPDGKVISGCDWGNMLLWEEGLIQVEARRKQGKTCHTAPITHFEFEYSGDLITAGMDGFVKLWFFDTIDGANPSEEFPYVELEPMFELKIEDDHSTASIMTMIKIYEEPKNQEYYCQDGNGGIWRYDIYSESNQRQPAEKLFICHAGPVMDIATSPVDEHFASLGKDGRLFVYNYIEKKLLFIKKFNAEGTCLIWLPVSVDPSGSVLVAAFNDGCIRVLVISIAESKKPHPDGTEFVNLIQIIKAHDKAITIMSMNQKGTVLVTGSEEARIFVFNIKREINKKYIRLDPIGFVPVANSVTFLAWKPFTGTTLLVCCKGGEFVEMKIPEFVQRYTGVTYNLVEVETKTITFHSCKSQIERDIKIMEIEERKRKKLEKKREEMEKIKAENPGIDIDEDTFLEDSESEEELEPIFIPKEPNPILFGMYTPRNTIWISMAGYDAGFMYEYVMDKEEPVKCTPVKDAYEIPIHTFLYSHNRKYLILAMEDGRIRVNRVNQNDFTDLSDYWLYSMHDNFNGKIHRMCFNYDNHYMFTCGEDGSIFSYHVNFEDDKEYIKFWKKAEPHPLPTTERVEDIVDKTYLSLEGTKIKAEYDRKMALANLHKEKVLKELQKLKVRFGDIITRNEKLPASQKFPMSVFEIHPDITEDLNKKLQDEVDLVKRKLAFDVEKSTLGLRKVQDYFINILETMSFFVIAIRKKIIATSFRLRRLPDEFEKAKEDVRLKIEELERKGRGMEHHVVREEQPREPERKVPLMELFLKSIDKNSPEYKANKKLQRLIEKYLQRKSREEYRQRKWRKLWSKKPDVTKMHPSDLEAIQEAEETIGDFKLKSAQDYKVPKHLRISTVNKYDELLKARERMHMVKHNFNQEMSQLREKKAALIKRYEDVKKILKNIHKEIDVPLRKFAPTTPKFDEVLEFPEKDTEITEEELQKFRRKKMAESEEKLERMLLRIVSEVEIQEDLLPDPTDTKPVDDEYEPLLGSYIMKNETKPLIKVSHEPYFKEGINISDKNLQKLTRSDNRDSPLESELKNLRLQRKLHEQENILKEIEDKTLAFDKEVEELRDGKATAHMDSKILELHMLTLQQEVLILKDYEAIEDEVSNKVMTSLEEKHNLDEKIHEMQIQIDIKQRNINDILDKENDILQQFQQATAENKFTDYLKRIFKKKYKPPKIRDPDASSSSSESESESSSSESEGDEGSIESGDLGFMRYEEDVCPEGCDKGLYDLTFTLRGQRHELEQEVIEVRKEIDVLKKELDVNLKKIKVATALYETNHEELEILQREKQQRLNEVKCLVLLKLDKIHSFREDSDRLEDMSKTLVFSRETLKKLYARVGELDKETQEQMEIHIMAEYNIKSMVSESVLVSMVQNMATLYSKQSLTNMAATKLCEFIIQSASREKNRKHLHRLKLDCQYMVERIRLLKEDINECMFRKFNGRIDLDELEEAILRRLVAEMRSSLKTIKEYYEKVIQEMKDKLNEKHENLCRCIQENTQKLNLLIALEGEKNELQKLLRIQTYRLEEAIEEKQDPYKSDIKKLNEIQNRQSIQIEVLKSEIKKLSLKSRPLPPISAVSKTSIPEPPMQEFEAMSIEEEEEEDKDLADVDPTGVRGILYDIIENLPSEGALDVKQILSEVVDVMQEREPSGEDLEIVQQVLNEVIAKIGPRSSIAPTVEDVTNEIVNNVLEGTPADDISFIQNIMHNIIQDVYKVSGDISSVELIGQISERISSRTPLPNEPEHFQDTLVEVVQKLKSSEALYDPISAAQQIVYEIVQNLKVKNYSATTFGKELSFYVDNLQAKINSESINESVKEILRNAVETITSKLSSIEEHTQIADISDSLLKEITPGEGFGKDYEQAKIILNEIFAKHNNSLPDIAEEEEN